MFLVFSYYFEIERLWRKKSPVKEAIAMFSLDCGERKKAICNTLLTFVSSSLPRVNARYSGSFLDL
jgi:hypothetical protein